MHVISITLFALKVGIRPYYIIRNIKITICCMLLNVISFKYRKKISHDAWTARKCPTHHSRQLGSQSVHSSMPVQRAVLRTCWFEAMSLTGASS